MNLLINPTTMLSEGYAPPPLGLLYLAALDEETVVFDAAQKGDPREMLRRERPKTVGVTLYTPGRHEGLEILRQAKELGATTVAGGPHVGVMLKQLAEQYPFIDYLVPGDGELAWQAICQGKKLPRIVRMPVADLDRLPQPRWQAVDLLSYPGRGQGVFQGVDLAGEPRVSVVLGRGCHGRCTFCSSWWVNGKYRAHQGGWMRENLRQLQAAGVKHLVFQDDCLTADRNAAGQLAEILAEFQFVWFGTTRVDKIDLDLARQFRSSGCYELSFGIESGSAEILARMHKEVQLEQALRARLVCHQAGLRFTALMMYGFPFETERSYRETQEFLSRLAPDAIGSIGFTMVLPGTTLYQACKLKGLIDDNFWLSPEPYYVYRGGLE